jgi:hypothetical protein
VLDPQCFFYFITSHNSNVTSATDKFINKINSISCHPLVTHSVSLKRNCTRLSRGRCPLSRGTGSSGWIGEDNHWTKGLGCADRELETSSIFWLSKVDAICHNAPWNSAWTLNHFNLKTLIPKLCQVTIAGSK